MLTNLDNFRNDPEYVQKLSDGALKALRVALRQDILKLLNIQQELNSMATILRRSDFQAHITTNNKNVSPDKMDDYAANLVEAEQFIAEISVPTEAARSEVENEIARRC